MSHASSITWQEQIERLIAERNPVVRDQGVLSVATDVTMPSGMGVTVLVAGGRSGETVSVTDGGAAIREVRDIGLQILEHDLRGVHRTLKNLRMTFGDGEIRAPLVPVEDVGWAIALVANVARDMAMQLLKSVRVRRATSFKDRVNEQLMAIFKTAIISRGLRVAGITSRSYRFDYGIRLADGRHLTLDLPEPEPSAISATIVRNIDVGRRKDGNLIQAIAWDDEIHWQGEILDQLRLAGVPLLKGSVLTEGLPRLAGEAAPIQTSRTIP